MLLTLIYDIFLFFLALFASPFIIYRVVVKNKYRDSFLKRLGFGFPVINKGNRKLIWIHAVSVGETKAVVALAKAIKNEWNNPIILISSVTETGHTEAKKSMSFADYHVYLPLDFSWIIGRLVKRIRPDFVILTESDFWFNFLRASKKIGAKTALVNGKMSKRSFERFQRNGWFHKTLFSFVDRYCVQSDDYAERFRKLGVPDNKIFVPGNLKYDETNDSMAPEALKGWKKELGINDDDLVLVLGSTHDPEEKLLFTTLNEVWKKVPQLKVIVVPRHPERFSEVASILRQYQLPFVQYSKKEVRDGHERVILMDAMGLLRKCYQISDLALVAGSYTSKVGGHSIIEPLHYGVPVIYGPFMHTQQDMVDLIQKNKVGFQVPVEELSAVLTRLLCDPRERQKIGESGLSMIKNLQGITKKTEKCLSEIRHM